MAKIWAVVSLADNTISIYKEGREEPIGIIAFDSIIIRPTEAKEE